LDSCPICKSENEKIFLSKVNLVFGTEYDLLECINCGVIYFNSLPTITDLNKFYSASYYNFNRWNDEGKGAVFAKKLTKLKKKGKFLDVGCATGFFINGIKQNSQ